jgi:hypothetical protein
MLVCNKLDKLTLNLYTPPCIEPGRSAIPV